MNIIILGSIKTHFRRTLKKHIYWIRRFDFILLHFNWGKYFLYFQYNYFKDAFSNIKIKEDLIELNENMTKDKYNQHKITKYEVLKV